jgi:hypothetical protein
MDDIEVHCDSRIPAGDACVHALQVHTMETTIGRWTLEVG